MRLLVEFRRRGILKVATAYLVVSWLTLEIGHVLFNIFELPHGGLQVIFVLLALGFPLTLFAVWHGWLAALTGAPASGEASHAAPEAGHHGGGHEGPLLAGIFGVVALIAVATVIGVRFFGMGHSSAAHGTGHEVAATAEPPREPARRVAPAKNSVAVLPFADLSPGKDQAYLSDGLAEEIMSALSGIAELHVAARTSAFAFKDKETPVDEIGARLGVAQVIEGSVRRANDRLRITVQLIDASNGFQVWSRSYDRDAADIFAVQREISGSIVEQLHVRLTGRQQNAFERLDAVNQEAYDLYLRGRYAWAGRSPAGLHRAVEYFESAIQIDPKFARAYVGLADALIVLPLYTDARPADVQPRAKQAALEGVSLDPSSAEAQASLGYILMSADRDWTGAGRALRAALQLNPDNVTANHWYGDYLAAQGQVAESSEYYERAAALDPLSATIRFSLGWLYMAQRKFEAAVSQLEKASELDPSLIDARVHLARTRLFMGQQVAATAALEEIARLSARNAMHLAFLGHAYGTTGRHADARRLIEELKLRSRKTYVSPLTLAIIHIGLGERDDAFRELEQAREAADPWLTENNFDLIFDPLRSDSRWRKLRSEMGFSTADAEAAAHVNQANK
jgi:TolB-like protein/Flp pilus assembly protein TadD